MPDLLFLPSPCHGLALPPSPPCSKVIEHAGLPHLTQEQRCRHLNFVVVGGGPTGVELAAELHDFVKEDVARLMPHLKVCRRPRWL